MKMETRRKKINERNDERDININIYVYQFGLSLLLFFLINIYILTTMRMAQCSARRNFIKGSRDRINEAFYYLTIFGSLCNDRRRYTYIHI